MWLTQQQLEALLQTAKQNIRLHIQNIYEEGELTPETAFKKILTVRSEGTQAGKSAVKGAGVYSIKNLSPNYWSGLR